MAQKAGLAYVDFLDATGAPAGGRLYLRRMAGTIRRGLCFVPTDAERARLDVWGVQRPPEGTTLSFRQVRTAEAAVRLFARHPRLVTGLAWEIGPTLLRPEVAKARLRDSLAQAVAADVPVEDYRLWSSLFDIWSPDDLLGQGGPSIGFLVFHRGLGVNRALDATLASLRRQHGPAQPHVVVERSGRAGLRAALSSLSGCDYVGILQAGEVLPPHASLLARGRLSALGLPAVAYADEDKHPADGGPPASPLFKPMPNRALMLSGTLSRGLWLVRRGLLANIEDNMPDIDSPWAEALRLDLWLRLHETGRTRAGGAHRLPFVLAHRRSDTAITPPELLAHIVNAHLRRTGLPFEAGSGWPLRVRSKSLPQPGRVTIVVPSTFRPLVAEHCIKAVLAGTRHTNFELVVAVSQADPLDAAQRAVAIRIEADARARVLPLRAERFNF